MNQLMTPQQVGTKYGVTVQELAEWRRKKIGPAYYLLGTRVIRYLPENVDLWFHGPANSRWHDVLAGTAALSTAAKPNRDAFSRSMIVTRHGSAET